ncbi:hypothetical protein L0B53_13515 [Vibrio sp. SS-MA-C1-2]|uniref:hypothetical protein n=1 Tax=Vibrio sp. SS-MA-C1-2 TaxID=2908646 RepID=UPI001F37885B|nr:hypothetical protein [Vibrio sp. SS-MA-C1-2]UJF18036.1 hypothetical protein L0B53_13515 [Vibrio sp. SS-MA-C1-2]
MSKQTLIKLLRHYQVAESKQDIDAIEKSSLYLSKVLSQVDQHDSDLRPVLVELKAVHLRCAKLIDQQLHELKGSMMNNSQLKIREKAYAKTQMGREEI